MSEEASAKKTVLLVEDEHPLRALYKEILEQAGFNVIESADGDSALKMILREPWDVLVLDIMLPKKDGLEVLKEARKNPKWKKGPIILLTNLNSEEIIDAAFNLGGDGYLVKSEITPDKIVDEIKSVLKNSFSVFSK